MEIGLLQGVERQKQILLDNTLPLRPRPAGQQRDAVGRARHGQVLAGEGHRTPSPIAERPGSLALIEIHREDIALACRTC